MKARLCVGLLLLALVCVASICGCSHAVSKDASGTDAVAEHEARAALRARKMLLEARKRPRIAEQTVVTGSSTREVADLQGVREHLFTSI